MSKEEKGKSFRGCKTSYKETESELKSGSGRFLQIQIGNEMANEILCLEIKTTPPVQAH